MNRVATRKRQVESTAQQFVLLDEPDGYNVAAPAFACSCISRRVWALNNSREL
jgi:hypothetical protein